MYCGKKQNSQNRSQSITPKHCQDEKNNYVQCNTKTNIYNRSNLHPTKAGTALATSGAEYITAVLAYLA